MTADTEGAWSTAPGDGHQDTPPGTEPAPAAIPWLLAHKVELPDPTEGYVERPALEARCMLTDRRLTVLHAPGGFGKTALLGRCCRALRERDVPVAWLSLDEEDGPGSLATHLALAFERAGLESLDAVNGDAAALAPDTKTDSKADYRINLLLRALERHGAPCVLAIDEVERLQRPEAVTALNTLLRRAPANLHVGMAYRERPPGLEVAMFELEGRAATVTVDDLRFSTVDIERLFERRLSRRELDSVLASSEGWPIALRIHRNAEGEEPAGPGANNNGDLIAGWIETRLWRGISGDDRDFVLDAALFDPIEADLIEEAAGVRNAGRRLASMGVLAGLLSTTGGGGSTMRLHPLVRDYCEKRRFDEAPERFRALHRAIAEALARRGRSLEALRHAREARDPDLLGRLAENTGAVQLWLSAGIESMRTVDRMLTEDVLLRYPRLALLRCMALTLSDDIPAAKRVYDAAAARTAGFTRDREGGDDEALQDDHLLANGMLEMCCCTPYAGPMTELLPMAIAVAEATDVFPQFRGMISLGICMMQNQKAAFDAALEWAQRAREEMGHDSPYLAHVDFQLGSVAMVRGHAGEARRCYDRALEVARASHLRDAGAMMLGQVLSAELAFERSAGAPGNEGTELSPQVLGECGAWLDIYAASAEVRAEVALLRHGSQEAYAVVDGAREHAQRTERASLARFLSALGVSVLAAGGEVGEAERAWRVGRLPEDVAGCIDLERQSWRDAEMLACARLRLLTAQGAFHAARELGGALLAAAEQRQLVRTSMRGLALSIALEHRAENRNAARAHLLAYLRLFSKTGYVRPLARERVAALPLLDEVAGGPGVDDAAARTAARLREAIREPSQTVPDT